MGPLLQLELTSLSSFHLLSSGSERLVSWSSAQGSTEHQTQHLGQSPEFSLVGFPPLALKCLLSAQKCPLQLLRLGMCTQTATRRPTGLSNAKFLPLTVVVNGAELPPSGFLEITGAFAVVP